MDFIEAKHSFIKYVNYCEELIMNRIFTEKDSKYLPYKDGNDINDIITSHRLKMIRRKIEHTMRMIDNIEKVNEKMNLKFNFREVMKVAILYHDIGRFRQATWSNTFSDTIYEEVNSHFRNHGEDGYDIFINNDFNVDRMYIPVIGMSILHHLDYTRVKKLNYKFTESLDNYNIDDVVTGKFNLNEGEWQAAALIVSLVADIDKADILYQFLIDEINITNDFIYDKSHCSIKEIASNWSISEKEILDYNNITESEFTKEDIKIPITNLDLNKLIVSNEIRDMFYNNTWLPLSELKKRSDWNFVTAWWWRLSVFLNQISFYSTLEAIQTSEVIEKIYTRIPDNMKFLFEEAFTYAKDVLIKDRLDNSVNKLYL